MWNGGTVGDIESLPFVEAIRQFSNENGKSKTLFIHLTFVPFLNLQMRLKQNQLNILLKS